MLISASTNFILKRLPGYIQTEIRAFGGDPTSVTLAGQSSGAELIKALLVTPFASKLFHRTIIQAAPLAYPEIGRASCRERVS